METEHTRDDAVEESTKAFPLLNLPPEIWSKICEYAVVSNELIIIRKRIPPTQPAVTRVCKVLHVESLPMFYKQNEFLVIDEGDLCFMFDWFAAIGLVNRVRLEHLYVTSSFWRLVAELYADIRGRVEILAGCKPTMSTSLLRPYTAKVVFHAPNGIMPPRTPFD